MDQEAASWKASRWSALPSGWVAWLLWPAGLASAALFGMAVAQGGTRGALALTLAGTLAIVPLLRAFLFRHIRYGLLTVEIPLLLLLLSNLVLRIRSAEDLAYNPLDPAAQFRVALMLVALGLGAIALISPGRSETRIITPLFALYIAYVVVVFLGAPLSVKPLLTIFRGIELVAAVVVIAGARRSIGAEATVRIEAILYWFGVTMLASVWIGLALFPEEARNVFSNTYVPWKFQISGALPSMSSNTVGALSVLMVMWSLARVDVGRSRRSIGRAIAAGGVLTLVAAQYRTGYVALLLALGVWVLVRKRWALASAIAAVTLGIALFVPSLVTQAEPYVLRGQTTEQAQQLSSRLSWWSAAIPVWQQSPLIGRGLLTATRFEVLEPLGETTTSTIHSTWVEALTGTGIVGLGLLAALSLSLLRRAAREVRIPGGSTVPLLLLVVLLTRSLTGNTFESFGYFALVILWLASSTDEWPTLRRPVMARTQLGESRALLRRE